MRNKLGGFCLLTALVITSLAAPLYAGNTRRLRGPSLRRDTRRRRKSRWKERFRDVVKKADSRIDAGHASDGFHFQGHH